LKPIQAIVITISIPVKNRNDFDHILFIIIYYLTSIIHILAGSQNIYTSKDSIKIKKLKNNLLKVK